MVLDFSFKSDSVYLSVEQPDDDIWVRIKNPNNINIVHLNISSMQGWANKFCFPNEIEIFCIELTTKWKKYDYFFCCYKSHKPLLKHHLFPIESAINFYSNKYENLIISGDFNVEISDLNFESFYTIHCVKSVGIRRFSEYGPENLRTPTLFTQW